MPAGALESADCTEARARTVGQRLLLVEVQVEPECHCIQHPFRHHVQPEHALPARVGGAGAGGQHWAAQAKWQGWYRVAACSVSPPQLACPARHAARRQMPHPSLAWGASGACAAAHPVPGTRTASPTWERGRGANGISRCSRGKQSCVGARHPSLLPPPSPVLVHLRAVQPPHLACQHLHAHAV